MNLTRSRLMVMVAGMVALAAVLAGCTQAPTSPAPTAAVTPTPAPGSDAVKMVNGVQVVTVHGNEFGFSPSNLQLNAGPTKFVFVNDGKITHELILYLASAAKTYIPAHRQEMMQGMEGPGHNESAEEEGAMEAGVAEIENVAAGATQESEVVNLAPGTYEMGCLIPGHYEAGMKGTITVTGTPAPSAVTTENGVQTVNLVGTDFAFAPSSLALSPGKVQLVLTNHGATVHEVLLYKASDAGKIVAAAKGEEAGGPSLEDASGSALLAGSEDANPGQTVHTDVVTLGPGTYEFACFKSGHYEAGMKGTITVA